MGVLTERATEEYYDSNNVNNDCVLPFTFYP